MIRDAMVELPDIMMAPALLWCYLSISSQSPSFTLITSVYFALVVIVAILMRLRMGATIHAEGRNKNLFGIALATLMACMVWLSYYSLDNNIRFQLYIAGCVSASLWLMVLSRCLSNIVPAPQSASCEDRTASGASSGG